MFESVNKILHALACFRCRSNFFKGAVVLSFILGFPSSASALSFSVDLIDASQNVKPGDRLYFDADFKFPENQERQDLRIRYEIVQDDIVISASDSLKAVETQIQFNDSIFVPTSVRSGSAELSITVSVGQVVNAHASVGFNVVKGRDQMSLYVMFIISSILFIGLMISLQMYYMHVQTRALVISEIRGKRSGFFILLPIILCASVFLAVALGLKSLIYWG